MLPGDEGGVGVGEREEEAEKSNRSHPRERVGSHPGSGQDSTVPYLPQLFIALWSVACQEPIECFLC